MYFVLFILVESVVCGFTEADFDTTKDYKAISEWSFKPLYSNNPPLLRMKVIKQSIVMWKLPHPMERFLCPERPSIIN